MNAGHRLAGGVENTQWEGSVLVFFIPQNVSLASPSPYEKLIEKLY